MPTGTAPPAAPREPHCIMVGCPQLTSSSCRRSSREVTTVAKVGAASGTGPVTLPLLWRRLRLGRQPTQVKRPGRKERSRCHWCCWLQGAGAGRDKYLGQFGEKSPQEMQPRAACCEGSCFSPQPPSRCPSPLRALSLSIAAGCPQIDTMLSLGPPPTGPTSNWATAGTHARGI